MRHPDTDLVDVNDKEQLAAAVRERVWFHSIDLGDGIVTKGQKPPELLAKELEALQWPDFTGKTVLDIGAYDGFYSFAAERLGASRVVALDRIAWEVETHFSESFHKFCAESGFVPDPPYRSEWLRWELQPEALPGKKKFDLVRRALGSKVEPLVRDLMKTGPEDIGTFDVVLFMGVLYHLEEPLNAMRRIAALTRDLAIIETEAIAVPGHEDRAMWEFYPFDELNGDYSNWWAPNEKALVGLCRAAGFEHVEIKQTAPTLGDSGGLVHYRAMLHARKRAPIRAGVAVSPARGESSPAPSSAPAAPAFPQPPGASPDVSLYVPLGHYFSPIPPRDEVARYFAAFVTEPLPEELPGIAIDRPKMRALWESLAPLMRDSGLPDTATPGYRYHCDNNAYAWGDGLVLHAMIRHFRPRRLIEIGSGWSSACTLDTVERHLEGHCALTFIDPYPELVRSLIGTSAGATVVASRVQDVAPETFDVLEAGDVLFIDSTHVLRTGGDVCFDLFGVLPRLKPGVLVHFHDIFWPFEYPADWVVSDGRAWNEAYALRALLTETTGWDIVMFNDMMSKLERRLVEATCPRFFRNTGGALWLQRRRSAAR